MSTYNKILVAVDVSKEAELVINKAKQLAEQFASEIILIHVVEPVIIEDGYNLVPIIDASLEVSLVDRSKAFLQELSKKNGLDSSKLLVTVGSAKTEIHKAARDNEIDLIVIGTHGRHGIAMLLGSTANAILHGAPCDILSVKIIE